MTVCSVAYGEVVKLWACGTYLCIKLPLRTLRLCWKAQLFLICFPFQCTHKMYVYIKQVTKSFLGSKQEISLKELQNFIECDLVGRREVLNSVQELKAGSLMAMTKMDDIKKRIDRYQRQVSSWRNMAEKHSEQLSRLATQEGKLLRVIMSALKSLKRLRASRAALDSKFSSNVKETNYKPNMNGCSVSIDQCVFTEIDQFLEASHNRQAELIRYFTKDGYFQQDQENGKSICFCDFVNNSEDNSNVCHTDLVNLSMGALSKIMSLLNAENVELRKRLKESVDQLRDMKHSTHSLNEKVASLELQLKQVNRVLKSVEAERDLMKDKLQTLNGMIEEEEVYLNEESSGGEDSYNELYVSTKDFDFSDLDSSSATDYFGKIEHMELEWNSLDSDDYRDSKSVEFVLSR